MLVKLKFAIDFAERVASEYLFLLGEPFKRQEHADFIQSIVASAVEQQLPLPKPLRLLGPPLQALKILSLKADIFFGGRKGLGPLPWLINSMY